ncbi:hypothetical protein HPP92_018666 [Vanilla planifolia]|uniref:Uncharacterized protein n=1 Tax=Vanilla planifolia TaxID=51239 RepID=A0A835UN15_VANPL|nr:hypothetical protein HPP92_019257 [Vanilla planifolia]KAG0469338.1 hypothetical protein HPP92_018666 [Vanilla planifolia]
MDRSIRATEFRGRTKGTLIKEKEEELALFMEMRKRDKERNNLLLQNSEELDQPLESHPWGSPTFKIIPTAMKKASMEDFLSTDSDKNDYDWLLTPPGTPLFQSLEKDSYKSPVSYLAAPKAHPTLLRSRLAKPSDPASGNTTASRQLISSSLNSLSRRPSSSGDSSVTLSRPITPNGRPAVSAASKPSRSSTPTARPTLPSKSSAPPPRSSTPSRSSTPISRPIAPPVSKPTARSATPTRRPSTPTNLPASSVAPNRSSATRSAPTATSVTQSATVNARSGPTISITRTVPTTSKASSAPSSRGTSPTVKSRPWKPNEMPGFSHDAPPNLRTSLPERPSSACRGRPGAPRSNSSFVESVPTTRPRRQSCSPSRGRASNGNAVSGSSVPAASRSRMNGCDSESPVVIGTKMVERVVNLRRLAPPKLDEHRSIENPSGKSTVSPESTGFGRTLSKKSLDMAIRHMDIRRSIPSNLRPLMTNIPASSIYSVRSGSTKSRGVSMSDSPLATSSNASSESVSNNAFCFDANELLGDICSDKVVKSSPFR